MSIGDETLQGNPEIKIKSTINQDLSPKERETQLTSWLHRPNSSDRITNWLPPTSNSFVNPSTYKPPNCYQSTHFDWGPYAV